MVATTLVFGMLTTVCQAYTLERQQMCSGDAMRLCSSEIPNVERITACMERQRESLSEGCRAVFEVTTPAATTAAPVRTEPAAQTAAPVHNKQAAKPSKPITLTPKLKHG
jgi:hypothetical protein